MTEGPRTLRLWRTGLACVLLLDLRTYVEQTVPSAREHVAWAASAGRLGAIAGSWTVTAVLGVAALASIVAFARARDPLLPGLLALVVARAQHELLSAVLGVYQHDYYPAAGALAGWVAGRAFVRAWNRFERPPIGELDAERIAAYGALGMLAATWVNAGTSKIARTGLDWATSDALRLMMLSHLHPGHAPWREAVVLFVVAHPGAAVLFQTMTLAIELGAVLMLAGGRLRIAAAAALVALHAGIYATSGIQFADSPLLAALFGFPWISEPPSDDAPSRALYQRRPLVVVSVATALVLAVLVASPLPRRVFPASRAGLASPPAAGPPGSPAPARGAPCDDAVRAWASRASGRAGATIAPVSCSSGRVVLRVDGAGCDFEVTRDGGFQRTPDGKLGVSPIVDMDWQSAPAAMRRAMDGLLDALSRDPGLPLPEGEIVRHPKPAER